MRSIAVALCATFLGCASHVEGQVRVSNGNQNTTYAPLRCMSGDARGFFGADVLFERDDHARSLLRIADDAFHGKLVRLYEGGDDTQYVELTSASCRRFEVEIRQHGAHTEGVHYMGGRTAFECQPSSTTNVSGNTSFDWCAR